MRILWVSKDGICRVAKEVAEKYGRRTLIKDSALKGIGKSIENLLRCQDPRHATTRLKNTIKDYDGEHPGGEITHVVFEGTYFFLNGLFEDMKDEKVEMLEFGEFYKKYLA